MVTPVTKPCAEAGERRMVAELRRIKGCIVVRDMRGLRRGGGADGEREKGSYLVVYSYIRVVWSRGTMIVGYHDQTGHGVILPSSPRLFRIYQVFF
jgi:hypothetical protein